MKETGGEQEKSTQFKENGNAIALSYVGVQELQFHSR